MVALATYSLGLALPRHSPVGTLRPFRFQLFDRPLEVPLFVGITQHVDCAPITGLLSLEYLLSTCGNGHCIDAAHARSVVLSAIRPGQAARLVPPGVNR